MNKSKNGAAMIAARCLRNPYKGASNQNPRAPPMTRPQKAHISAGNRVDNLAPVMKSKIATDPKAAFAIPPATKLASNRRPPTTTAAIGNRVGLQGGGIGGP